MMSGVKYKKLLAVTTGVIIIFIFVWFYRTSYVEVTVTNGTTGFITYSFTDERSGKSTEVKTQSHKLKRQVSKGGYEVEVRQGSTSFLSTVRTKGFLGKVAVTAKVAPENNRTFIGDNPSSCMIFTGSKLASYTCGDLFKNTKIHVPATASSPTFATEPADASIPGTVERIVNTPTGIFALVRSSAYSLYKLDDNLNVLQVTPLPNLSDDKKYSMMPYKQGFIIYDLSLDRILIYSAADSTPQQITLKKPGGSELEPTFLDFIDNNSLALYTSESDFSTTATPRKQLSEIIVNQVGQSSDYKFNRHYTMGRLCGVQEICLLGEKNMDVYKIGGRKPDLQFTIDNVSSIERAGNHLLVVNKTGILEFSPSSQSGHYEYTFGSYSFNGLETNLGGSYLINLANSRSQSVALLVDPGAPNQDSIDKKISQLLTHSEVKNLSVYKNYIFISPNFGTLSYQPALGGYGPSPSSLSAVNSKIETDISASGIDTRRYIVTNPYK
jgi:hypothetical protein